MPPGKNLREMTFNIRAAGIRAAGIRAEEVLAADIRAAAPAPVPVAIPGAGVAPEAASASRASAESVFQVSAAKGADAEPAEQSRPTKGPCDGRALVRFSRP